MYRLLRLDIGDYLRVYSKYLGIEKARVASVAAVIMM